MTDTVLEGVWDCSDCGQVRIRGTKKFCPRCGEPQNSILTPAEDWYLPQGALVVTDAAELAGADKPIWYCGHDGIPNDGDTDKCSRCGRPMDWDDLVNRKVRYDDLVAHDPAPDRELERAETDLQKAERMLTTEGGPRVLPDIARPEAELPTIGQDTEFYEKTQHEADERFNERFGDGDSDDGNVKILPPIIKLARTYVVHIAVALVALVLLIGGFVACNAVRAAYATVAGTVSITETHWSRSVNIEELKTFNEEGWTRPDPNTVRNLNSQYRFHYNRKVIDGYRTVHYTDYETRYRPETYMGSETRTRTVTKNVDCSYTQSNGNGKFTRVSRTCPKSEPESYEVPVQKTRQVPYQVPVQKTRQEEISHQEPVTDPYYTYQVDRWVTTHSAVITDVTTHNPSPTDKDWPTPTDLKQDNQPGDQVGDERLGNNRSASYAVVYVDSKGLFHREDNRDYALWSKLKVGQTVPALYYEQSGQLVSVTW